jgi:hypothetical protein
LGATDGKFAFFFNSSGEMGAWNFDGRGPAVLTARRMAPEESGKPLRR